MYQAKAARSRYELYRAERNTNSRRRIELIGQLGDAIAGGQLVVHYQPKVVLESGAVTGVEALVRWQHPERGLLLPAEFLPAAEQTGLIRPLTMFVLDAALAECARWGAAGRALGVAVNLSAVNLIDRHLPAEVQAVLERHGVPAERLCLEVTENVVMADHVRAQEVLGELTQMGVRSSLDDFGTGYSSLAYLSRLQVDELKIDRTFVSTLGRSGDAAAIVRSIIELGRSLGLRVVAEGVETDAEREFLAAHGCGEAQGFLFSPPLPAHALDAWLDRWQRTAA
jgi:EAL domain-containing protein (putative c-di-GMP-specific phosphodiesterase class I)